jgi:hypothetical protein
MLPDLSLLWAAIPLLLLPWRSAPERLGIAASRLVVTGFGLGALQVATGSLGLAELASWAAREGNAGFMALTIGVLVSGALVPTLPLSRWSDWLPGLPLLVATGLLLASVGLHRGLAVGIAIGTLPTLGSEGCPWHRMPNQPLQTAPVRSFWSPWSRCGSSRFGVARSWL